MRENLTGQRFGRLVAIHEVRREGEAFYRWHCQCDCGKKTSVPTTSALTSGDSRSCGCLRSEVVSKGRKKHGCSYGSKLYSLWKSMRKRCNAKNNPEYKNYGGRGITICSEWDDFAVFAKWAEETGYKDGLGLRRLDNDGPFSPSNCKWAVSGGGGYFPRFLTHNGVTKSVREWAKELGCSPWVLTMRLDKLDWSVEKTVTTPVRHKKPNRWRTEHEET